MIVPNHVETGYQSTMSSSPSRLTLNDVARHAGVSRGTVSNVFTHPERVRAEVRQRVEAVAREIGYAGPDPRGRLLRAGTFNALGFVVPGVYGLVHSIESPYGRELLLGIAEACDTASLSLTLIDGKPDQVDAAIRNALIDGLIVGNSGNLKIVDHARQRGLPVAMIDIGAGPDIPSAGVDAFIGAEMAARHLVQLGHKRFAIVSVRRNQGPPIIHPAGAGRALQNACALDREKIRGYASGLAAAGIDIDSAPIIEAVPWEPEIAAAVLAAAPKATGLLVMADRQASTLLADFKRRHIRVPEEISVVGFDGVAESAMTSPPLTTISQATREKGRLAVALLIEGGAPRQISLPVRLVVRGSSGPAPN